MVMAAEKERAIFEMGDWCLMIIEKKIFKEFLEKHYI